MMVNEDELERVVEIVKNGGVVIFPTDTVYGIGCRFDNKKAIERIYQIKGTSKIQPFPILVSSIEQVEKLARVNQLARDLMKKYWPGGLTIILNKIDGRGKIGFRMTDSDFVRELVEKVGVPIVGTSANFHGQAAPITFEELDPNFVKLADFVIKGICKLGIESTVVDATFNPPRILRQGAVKHVVLIS